MSTKSSVTPAAEGLATLPIMSLLTTRVGDFAQVGGRELRPYERYRVERIHATVPMIINKARDAGVDINYIGISDLFNGARVYRGIDNDWVFAPVDDHEEPVAPRKQQQLLRRLDAASPAPFLLYAAHEVNRERSEAMLGALPDGPTIVSRAEGAELVGPVPAHPRAVELADRLNGQAVRVLSVIRRAAPIAGGVLLGALAAPFALVGALVASGATLDPILIGAVPVLRADVGEPALFFELAQWTW